MMIILNSYIAPLKAFLNDFFKNKEPWQIVMITSSSILMTVWVYEFITQEIDVIESGKKTLFRYFKKIPFVRNKINEELKSAEENFKNDVKKRNKDKKYITTLAKEGKTFEEIIKLAESYFDSADYDWENGRVSGAVYVYDKTLVSLLTEIYHRSSYTNPLHPEVFPGVCKMEAEVIKIATKLFCGGPDACGSMTSGGTESILMAVKACRDYAINEKGIKYPNIVCPITAHPAFEKATKYLHIKIVYVKVNPKTLTVDISAMKKSITSNTCMLVGSVPNFPYGTMDDIEAIAAIGLKYNIPVHVDCCLGGFVIAFMENAGYSLPPFDFRVKGVTSISADTHKYGCTPKGSSLVLYSNKNLHHFQYTVTTDWPGGIYGSPTMCGSRAGGIIATSWATLMYFGVDGYIENTKRIIETTRFIESRLREMDEIYVFGNPLISVIAIGSNIFHIYRLTDALSKKGWSLNPLQFPPGIHIAITNIHTQDGVAEEFIADVRNSIDEIMKNPNEEVKGKLAIYGKSANIPDRSIIDEVTNLYLDSAYYTPEEELESKSIN